ncbi:uncharacterized protein LOC144436447 [Glandiceps talaboti]
MLEARNADTIDSINTSQLITKANVRSLRNKIDELHVNTKYLTEYRDSCLLCFSETWLTDNISNNALQVDGFYGPFRTDRDHDVTGKAIGGGVCIYVNAKWCKEIQVRESICTKDIELLCMSFRPYYLPREFGLIFAVVVYIPPSADTASAAAIIRKVVDRQETLSPDSPKLVLGDFNSCSLSNQLPNYHQYVTCYTRKAKTLDLCYSNIINAYKAIRKSPLSTGDHNAVHLIPTYRQKLKQNKPQTRSVQIWSQQSIEDLQGCLASTDWSVLTENNSLERSTDIITDYLKFCEDMLVEKRIIKTYANNKLWVTSNLKHLLKEKAIAFAEGRVSDGKCLQRKLKQEIRDCKDRYKMKIESQFQSGDLRKAWNGLAVLSGKQEKTNRKTEVVEAKTFANELNDFYCRFDTHNFQQQQENARNIVTSKLEQSDMPQISEMEVSLKLKCINPRKAQGPDNISGRFLRHCHLEVASIFTTLFNWSISTHTIPSLWKTSAISPVPKHNNPTKLNDYRPIALTSIVMKCLESIVLTRITDQVKNLTDPLQFAYRANRSVEDAVIALLHQALSHLEQPKSFVRILFVDFSSAFNTIQPHLMVNKLNAMNVNPNIILWVLDFLTNRRQYVRVNAIGMNNRNPSATVSSMRSTSTGAPQGSVISPVLFTLYTNDLKSTSEKGQMVKYADDTAFGDYSNDEKHFENQVHHLKQWCEDNYLELNTKKTKEMVIDFSRSRREVKALEINSEVVERVSIYRYLGTLIDDKLTFQQNTDAVYKKCQQRMYLLRKLRSLNIRPDILKAFYSSHIESVVTFSFLSWFGGLTVSNVNKLQTVVNTCTKICGTECKSMKSLYGKRALVKATKITNDPSHALVQYFEMLPLGRRYRILSLRTRRARLSYVPSAIRILNQRM